LNKEDNIRIAILDMYLDTPNQGMRGIREIIEAFGKASVLPVHYEIFDARGKNQFPGLDFDIYISTGGPGDPLESEGSPWEAQFFRLIEALKHHNRIDPGNRKHVFLICHSFQVFCRYYRYGQVSKRKSTSFGVMTCHKTAAGKRELLLQGLADPFWVVDSRDYQLTQPDITKIKREGGTVLCIEKYRPHINLERAVMAIRFDDAIVGTQFHPEADAMGMHMYLLKDEKRELVVSKFGEKKYKGMLEHLEDPDKIMLTHDSVLPRFLSMALRNKFDAVHS